MSTPAKLAPVEHQWTVGPVDLNGGAVEDTGAILAFQPEQVDSAGQLLAAEVLVDLNLDLGAVGVFPLNVTIPMRVLREAYRASFAPTIQPGEWMFLVPEQRMVRVTEAPTVDGTTEVHDGNGLRRVAARDLMRPRSWAPGHEPGGSS